MKKIPKMMRQIQRQNNKSSASLSDHRLCNASVGFLLDLRRGVWITEGVLSRVRAASGACGGGAPATLWPESHSSTVCYSDTLILKIAEMRLDA